MSNVRALLEDAIEKAKSVDLVSINLIAYVSKTFSQRGVRGSPRGD